MIPQTTACQAPLSFTISQSLPKLISIELVMPSNHLIFCRPPLFLPSVFPSIRVFSNESAFHIRWLKYWSFHFSISPSNKYSGLISFRMDWFDLLAVQGILKGLLQDHNSEASILQPSAVFMVQLSHTYMTAGALNLPISVLRKEGSLLWSRTPPVGPAGQYILKCSHPSRGRGLRVAVWAQHGHRTWRLLKLVTWTPLLLEQSSSSMQSVTAGNGQQAIAAPGRSAVGRLQGSQLPWPPTFRTCLGSSSHLP